MAIGLFLLFAQLGTLNIQDMLHAAEMQCFWLVQLRRRCPFCCWVVRLANQRNSRSRHGCQTQWPDPRQ